MLFRLYRETLVGHLVSLRVQAARGITVVAALKAASVVTSQASSIVLAVILVPRDFGIVAIAMFFIGLLDRFGNLGAGIGSEILQRQDRVDDALDTGATMRLLLAAMLTVTAIALAPWAAILYEEPAIADVMRVFSLVFLLGFAGFVSRVRLTRDLRFREVVLPDTIGKMTTSLLAVLLAVLGFGFWSLVHSVLVGYVVGFVLLYIAMPWRIRFYLDRSLVRELLSFGRWIFFSGLIAVLFYTLDNAVVGIVLGLTVLGYYLLAYTWGVSLLSRLNDLVDTVMFPVFSRMKREGKRMSRAFLETTRYVGYIAFPFSVLVAALAPDFVRVVLGSKWVPAILPMQLLAPAGLLLALAAPATSVLTALGRPQDVTMFMAIGAISMLAGLLPVLLLLGIEGLAALVTLSTFLMALWVWRRVGSELRVRRWLIYSAFGWPLIASVAAAGAVLVSRYAISSSVLGFLAQVLAGTVVYLLCMSVLTRGAFFREIRQFVVLATSSSRPRQPGP